MASNSGSKSNNPAYYVGEALRLLGFETDNDPSTVETPERFIRYLKEFMQPFNVEELLGQGFEAPKAEGVHGMVIQAGIPFRMVCEHHLLPAFGRAAVGYIPNQRLAGLSKLTRLVQALGTVRPSLQEVICEKVADTLMSHLDAKGSICLIEAEHTCMGCRGVNSPGVVTATSKVRGVFRDVPAAREEFFQIINRIRR